MRNLALFSAVLLLLATFSASAIEHDETLADPAQQLIFDHLTNEVRCLVCQNQTIADSTAPLAIDLRREIRQMLEAGRSEEEIKTFLLDRYGDFVLYRPRWQANTALLWLAPGLLLLIGSLGLWRIIRRRADLPVPTEDGDPPSAIY